MTAILFTLAVVALVVYGLERNHRRHTDPGPHLAGSTDTEDRDLPRVTADLHAAATHSTPNRARRTQRPVAPVHAARAA
ncbi:MAG: hypothetical protein HOV94_05795 [Saccharothrix sp.]|nr:hypothetical protein [Saccharothrix sp.]